MKRIQDKNCTTDYEKLLVKHGVASAIPYSTSGSFLAVDIINHQSFGIGFVRKIIPPNKIEVLFSTGSKLLICAPHAPAILPALPRPVAKRTKGHGRNSAAWRSWSRNSIDKEEAHTGWHDADSSD